MDVGFTEGYKKQHLQKREVKNLIFLPISQKVIAIKITLAKILKLTYSMFLIKNT